MRWVRDKKRRDETTWWVDSRWNVEMKWVYMTCLEIRCGSLEMIFFVLRWYGIRRDEVWWEKIKDVWFMKEAMESKERSLTDRRTYLTSSKYSELAKLNIIVAFLLKVISPKWSLSGEGLNFYTRSPKKVITFCRLDILTLLDLSRIIPMSSPAVHGGFVGAAEKQYSRLENQDLISVAAVNF